MEPRDWTQAPANTRLAIELRTLGVLNTYSTTELYPQPDLNVGRIVDRCWGLLKAK